MHRVGTSGIDLHVTSRDPESEPGDAWEYLFADLRVRSDRPLEPWPSPPAPPDEAIPERFRRTAPRSVSWTPVYDGPGLIQGEPERIRSFVGGDGEARIVYADGESYDISSGGRAIERSGPGARTWAAERVLGAPFALAGARRGLYVLHASALADDQGRAVALTAESGGGKSTLAAAATRIPLGLRRIADDQLPVRLGRRPTALPHFPQLKLTRAEQFSDAHRQSLELSALVELRLSGSAREARAARLSRAATARALVRATTAARAFDPGALAEHFERCLESAETLAGYTLELPVDLDRLGEALDRIVALPR